MKKYITLFTLSFLSSVSFVEAKGFNPEKANDFEINAKIAKLQQKQGTAEEVKKDLLQEQIDSLTNYKENKKLPEIAQEEKEFKKLMIETALAPYYEAQQTRKTLFKKEKKVDPFDTTETAAILKQLEIECKTAKHDEKNLIDRQIHALNAFNYWAKRLETEDDPSNETLIRLKKGALEHYNEITKQRARQVILPAPKMTWDKLEDLMVDAVVTEINNTWTYENGTAFGGALTG